MSSLTRIVPSDNRGRTAADLEEVSRGDTLFTALVDEDHHLRFLELLPAQATDQPAPHAIGHGTARASRHRG